MKKFYKDYYLVKGKYIHGDIALWLENEQETWGFITINLPGIFLQENEIAINGDIPNETIEELEELDLFRVDRTIQYNYGRYKIAELNFDLIEEYALEAHEN